MSATKHPAEVLFSDKHPLTSALNMSFDGVVEGVLTVSLNAPESFSDKDQTHVHTGFSTLFLDTVMGACVIGEMTDYVPIATVKLNCNHLKRMMIGEAVICRAKQTGKENGMAFISAEILKADTLETLSSAIGTFMIGTATKPLKVS